MAKHILKKTNRKVAVKVNGSGVTETITLATDCKNTGETLVDTPTVEVIAVTWVGATDAIATITRGTSTTPIMILQANAAGRIDLSEAEFLESIDSTEDIKVVTTGDMQVYLLLRKSSGYFIADDQQYSELP